MNCTSQSQISNKGLTQELSIIFRALQGVGGAGMLSLPSIAFFQLVPPAQYNTINTVSSCSMATALVVSPLIGGALSSSNHWPWIFYLKLVNSNNGMVWLTKKQAFPPAPFPCY